MPTAAIVGAGAGGLCAGARLAQAGWDVTVLERLRWLGGRWSTRDVQGFKLPTGAFLIALDDPIADTFQHLGLEFPVRPLLERPVYRVGGEFVQIGSRGGLRALLGAAGRQDGSDADAVLQAIKEALNGSCPGDMEADLATWLQSYGAGPTIVGAVHAMTQAFMGLNAVEVSARAFTEYLTVTAGRGTFGIPVHGSRGLADQLAAYVVENGGQVRTRAPVAEILQADGRIIGVRLVDGEIIDADITVSDVGIDTTLGLLSEGIEEPMASIPSAPGITAFVASREPYFDRTVVVTTGTRCICLVSTPTLIVPELAPSGWHYTETISTFASSEDYEDPKPELERHFADMDDLLPGWRENGKLLNRSIYRGSWPVYRAWPGHDRKDRFPAPGLALVGDSVKPDGWPGVGGCAKSAELVVEEIKERWKALA